MEKQGFFPAENAVYVTSGWVAKEGEKLIDNLFLGKILGAGMQVRLTETCRATEHGTMHSTLVALLSLAVYSRCEELADRSRTVFFLRHSLGVVLCICMQPTHAMLHDLLVAAMTPPRVASAGRAGMAHDSCQAPMPYSTDASLFSNVRLAPAVRGAVHGSISYEPW